MDTEEIASACLNYLKVKMATWKFPSPLDFPPKYPAVLCPADRVLNLYNQATGEQKQRISKNVRTWFYTAAHSAGWGGVLFVPEVGSLHGAGCILWLNQNAQVQIPSAYGVLTMSTDSSPQITDDHELD